MKKINLFVLTLMLVCVLGFTNIVSADNTASTQITKGNSIYSLVTSTDDLVAGEYIIANEEATAFLGENSGTIYTSVDSTNSAITWSVTVDSNYFVFINTENDMYLSYTGSGNNAYDSAELSDACRWTLSFNDDMHIVMKNVGSTTRVLEYNSGSPRFACYEGSQKELNLYKKTGEYTVADQFEMTDVMNTLNLSYSTSETTVISDYEFVINHDSISTSWNSSYSNYESTINDVDFDFNQVYKGGSATDGYYFQGNSKNSTKISNSSELNCIKNITINFNSKNSNKVNLYISKDGTNYELFDSVADTTTFTFADDSVYKYFYITSDNGVIYIDNIVITTYNDIVESKEETYTFVSTQLRFGLQVSGDLYDSLAATSYGVEYTNKDGDVKEVELKSSVSDGVYTMSAVFEIPTANIASDVTVRFYAVVDGEKIYTTYKTASVASVASAYTTMESPTDAVVAAMGVLTYLSKITA